MTHNGARALALLVLVTSVAACGLPRTGPNKREIYAGSVQRKGDSFVVEVNDYVTRATAVTPTYGFSPSFLNAGLVGSDTISPGDTVGLTVWENVDQGLLATQGTKETRLTEMQVDGEGYIFVPYAGRVKASGNSPEQLRQLITKKLDTQTPDPQVTVQRLAGNGATVSMLGAIGGQGVYPIERPTRTLSAMIAKAGGVTVKPDVAEITVKRGGSTGKVWLRDLYANPKLDIALRPGDVVLVEEDKRAFTALGATGAQSRVPFDTGSLSAIEAIATVGGLQTQLADPKGVFVFRNEPAEVANAVLGRNDLTGDQRMVYVLNLTAPNGMFLARDFAIRDGDTVYVTEAPYVQWQKTLAALTGPVTSANAVTNLGN
ncbi:polysaccharide biosynthesis/export family protein [Phaeovulum sp. W22_SRMD_FR3]|uniref:polysaccharide biosynthesis/export family protein n=1 Tax=Phaeovulum sp. W22_SRMD_FR3 TaxID=3240274 RepID=UPI003F997B52